VPQYTQPVNSSFNPTSVGLNDESPEGLPTFKEDRVGNFVDMGGNRMNDTGIRL
jgi:hypothetical protein